MGNPLSKDGIITQIVEAVPGGGLVTSPFHQAAGNSTAAGLIASTTTAGLSSIMDNVGVLEDRRQEVHDAASEKGNEREASILMEESEKKIADKARHLSAESGGKRILKSVHGTFLRAYDGEWKVDMAPSADAWEHWHVEDWNGKVVFKSIHSPDRFLRAHPDGNVDLADRPQAWETWTPFKNDDDSWSFLSAHKKWLSAEENGNVTTVNNCKSWEHFWLGCW